MLERVEDVVENI